MAHAAEAEVAPDGTVTQPLVSSSDPVSDSPVEHMSDPSRLIVSLSSEDGIAELEAHVASEKAAGRAIGMGGYQRTYSRPRKAAGPGRGGRSGGAGDKFGGVGGGVGGGNGGGGNGGIGNGQFGGGGGGRSGGNGRKGGGRSLQDMVDDTPASVGFAVVEMESDELIAEEVATLSKMPGVAFVEPDDEVSIDEYVPERNLRGGPRRHVQDIMDSMAMEQVRKVCRMRTFFLLLCFDVPSLTYCYLSNAAFLLLHTFL